MANKANTANDGSGPPSRYWPLDLIRALPYAVWKVGKGPNNNLVAARFFDKDKFFTAEQWQLHFFWAQEINPNKALILVPENQAIRFVDRVKQAFPKLRIFVPSEKEWPGLVADFGIFHGIEPYEMAAVATKEELDELKNQLHIDHTSFSKTYSSECLAALRKMIDDSVNCLTWKKKKARQEAKAASDAAAASALMKLQKYLGLRAPDDDTIENVTNLAADRKVPWTFSPPPVLISIDVEAYEHNSSCITEIGISTLDVADIATMPPGHLGKLWRDKIRAKHFRIIEYIHLTNKDFVSGCPENFRFGTSDLVTLKNAPAAIASCFRAPYSAPPPNPRSVNRTTPLTAHNHSSSARPIVLLGHDPKEDVKWLRKLGYDVANLANLVSTQDSAQLHGFLTGTGQKRSLATVLAHLDIEGWYLHNAGNDAWYTLAACLGLAVAHREGFKVGDQAENDKLQPKWGGAGPAMEGDLLEL